MSVVYSTPVFVKQKRLLCGLSAVSSLLGKVVEKAELDKLALQFHIDNCRLGGNPIDSAPDPNGNYTIEILILGLKRLGNLEINHAFCVDFDFGSLMDDSDFRGFLYASGKHYIGYPFVNGTVWNCDGMNENYSKVTLEEVVAMIKNDCISNDAKRSKKWYVVTVKKNVES